MRLKNILTAFLFAIAIGSAIASELLVANNAWVSKAQVPALTQPCEIKGSCSGGTTDCVISFNLNGNQYNDIEAFDGSVQTPTTCGNRLQMP